MTLAVPPSAFDEAAQAAYIAQLANTTGVRPSSITLTLVPGASTVFVNATIRAPDEATAQTAVTALDSPEELGDRPLTIRSVIADFVMDGSNFNANSASARENPHDTSGR